MQTLNAQQSAVTPQPGETYEDYVIRAHTALIDQVPDPAERNAAVWGLWEQTNGDAERQRAEARFGDGYQTIPMVPLFIEHEKVGQLPDGSETVTNYDVAELAGIIRENNFRIEDTDAYTGLVDKHTVPAGARDPMPPKTLGYVGPYRLGMLGRKHPRFAIFADEHHRKDRTVTLADRPRRSVEVLKLKANGRRYIDPIACLAEAPRLPLPVHHYMATDAVICERYSAIAPPALPFGRGGYEPDQYDGMGAGIGGGGGGSYPGGGNTFTQKPIGTHAPDRNAAGVGKAPQMHDQDPAGTVRQVIDALQSTEEWQALTELVQMMKQGDAEAGDVASGGAPVPETISGDDPAGMMPEPGGGPMGGPMGGGAAPMDYPEGMEQEPAPPMGADPSAMGGPSEGGLPPAPVGPSIGGPGQPPLGQPPGETPGMPALGEDAAAADQTLLNDPEEPDRNNPLLALAPMAARVAAPAVGRAAGVQAAKLAGGGARGAIAGAAGRAAGTEATGQLGNVLAGLRGQATEEDQNGAIGKAADAFEEISVGPLSKPATGNSRFSAASAAGDTNKTRLLGGSYSGHHRYQAPTQGVPDVNATQAPPATIEQYEALAAENSDLRAALAAQTTELEAVQGHNNSILTEQAEHYAALQYQVVELTQDRTDANRRSRLNDLANRFPIVTVADEETRCCYSAGSEMSDSDFETHIDTIERYAAAAAVASPMIPIGVEAHNEPQQLDVETARYAAADADRALEIVNTSIRAGERIDYPTAVAKAKSERAA